MSATKSTAIENPNESQLFTILILFVTLRLTILFLYSPHGILNAFTDYDYYFRTSQLSEQGFLPFVNMWYEYPPLSTYIVHSAYVLSNAIVPLNDLGELGFQLYSRVLGTILLIFECGNLILIHRIVTRTWDMTKANWAAWVYSGLSLPLFFWNASHSEIMVFFSLLAIERFIYQRKIQSAFALGLGIAAKLTPVLLIIPIGEYWWKNRRKDLLTYLGVVGATLVGVYLPFLFLGGGPWIAASFKAVGNVGSWSTIWSLIDGNWGPGNFGPLLSRTHLSLSTIQYANPAVIPEFLKLTIFAIPCIWFFFRYDDAYTSKKFVWLITLTAMIFHLWSKGWSPQWATFVIPLFLISFPNRRGLGMIILLMGFIFIEWPLSDAINSHLLAAIAILGRTAIFIYAAYLSLLQLTKETSVKQPLPSTQYPVIS